MKNKILIPLLMLILITSSFLCGFFLNGIEKPPAYTTNDEVSSILNKYHYQKPSLEQLYDNAINGLADGLDDKYTYIVEEDKLDGYFGITYNTDGVDFYVSDVLRDSLNYNILYPGDKFISVDNVETKNLNSNLFLKLFDKAIDEEINVKISRGTKELTLTIKASKQEISTYKLIDKTGYLKLNNFSSGAAYSFKTSLTKLEENNIDLLLLDLRGNGGGSLSELQDICNMLVKNNGKSYMTLDNFDGTKDYLTTTNTVKKPYDIKVLVDSKTASAAEALASILSEYMGYTLIGEKTYGKGVYQSVFPLSTKPGFYLNCTIGYWYTPNGNNINKIGITPDILFNEDKLLTVDKFDNSIDSVSNVIKNTQIMLSNFGYSGRVDGYFDNDLLNYLELNYNTSNINEEIYYQILSKYNTYLLDNDELVNKIIKGELN